MAIVSNIQNGGMKKQGSHKKTECSYYIVENESGKRCLQLDTYGSDERQIPGKISQSLLFSPEAIKQLKELLSNEF